MSKGKHLNFDEREKICLMKLGSKSIRSIAKTLKRNHSVIVRELKRNCTASGCYWPVKAQEMAAERRAAKNGFLESNIELRNYVIDRLKKGWSPQAIAGRMKFEQSTMYVCSESIYQFIYSNIGQRSGLYQYLVRKHPKRNIKCGRKPNKRTITDLIPISERPEYINQRAEIGHVEADLVFCRGNQSTNILTIVDRKTRFLLMAKNKCKSAEIVTKSFIQAVSQIKDMPIKSSTFDRGKEFAKHMLLKKILGIATFFCNPHSPWQKGQVENMNGRLRYFLPRKTDLKKVSVQQLKQIQDCMNNQPRKCLGYRTPNEVFFEELFSQNGGYCCV